MSWLFSQALVAAYSEGTSLAGAPSAQLNVMPTAQPFWRNDKPMVCSRFSRFGLTFAPLTDTAGEELLTSFLAAFPAKTLARPDLVTDLTEPDQVSGFRWPGSFAKYSPSECGWKTRQCSLLGGLVEYSETWPKWGLMRDGECSVQQPAAPTTCANGSGLLPTPVAVDSGSYFNQSKSAGAAVRPTLGAMARFNLWPTPTCGGGGQSLPEGTTPTGQTPDGRKQTVCLERAVIMVEKQLWSTPRANDAQKRGDFDVNNPRNGLPAAVRKFPTPTVSMRKGSSGGGR